MPIGADEQQQYECTTDTDDVDAIADAARSYSAKPHRDRGLPQIYKVASNSEISFLPQISFSETSITSTQLEAFAHDIDNDPENTSYRIWVNEADVDSHIRDLWEENPGLVARQIEEEGWDSFRQRIQHQLQCQSFMIALEQQYGCYEPDPTDPHYPLWKGYWRLKSLEIEEIMADRCCEDLVCEVDEESILHNERVYDRYNAKIAEHKQYHKEFQDRLLLAEKTVHAQQKRAAMRLMAGRRAPARARRAHAGHGASAKSGDDGDGGDGEPPRPRPTAHVPAPLLHSLTHSLIFAGGAQ